MTLAAFQQAFAAAVLHEVPAASANSALADLVDQPGFAVYRNTVMKGCTDALAANYPAVARLVGAEWFRAAARVFVRSQPPRRPSLIAYGAEFPKFLERFEPAAELRYLADVARLDRAWTEAHIAADDPRLAAAAVAELPAEKLANVVLIPHAAARWGWFADAPIFSIWHANRAEPAAQPTTPLWRGEGALITRPHSQVEAVVLGLGDSAFLDACAAGQAVVQAGLDAVAAAPNCDLPSMLQRLLRAGAFTRFDAVDRNRSTEDNTEAT